MLSSLTLDVSSVDGGIPATGSVTLTATAPEGGLLVTLKSDNLWAVVDSSVVVPEGQLSATFPVTTKAVPTPQTVTISASIGSSKPVSAKLSIRTIFAAITVASGPAIKIDKHTLADGNGAYYTAKWINDSVLARHAVSERSGDELPVWLFQIDTSGSIVPDDKSGGSDVVVGQPTLMAGKPSLIKIYYPDDITIKVNAQDLNYGLQQAPGNAIKLLDKTLPEAPIEYKVEGLYVTTRADDLEIDIAYTTEADPGSSSIYTSLPRFLVPVDYDLIHTQNTKVNYSIGLWYSNLWSDYVQLTPGAGGLDRISASTAPNLTNVKEAVLTHFLVVKHGDTLYGPFLGVASNLSSPNTTTSGLIGLSCIVGKNSRFAINVGWEFGTVIRLSNYTYGNMVPPGTTITQNVNRWSSLEIGLTFTFGTASTTNGQQSTSKPPSGG